MDRTLPVYLVAALSELVDASLATDRFVTAMLAVFAAAALLLAAVGIFGIFSADVVGRRREIGIPMALGSSDGR